MGGTHDVSRFYAFRFPVYEFRVHVHLCKVIRGKSELNRLLEKGVSERETERETMETSRDTVNTRDDDESKRGSDDV